MKTTYLIKVAVAGTTFILVMIAYSLHAGAQTKDSGKVSKPETNMAFGMDALSNAIYAGRNYGVDQYGFNPSLVYKHKSGWSISACGYGMSSIPGFIAETDLQAAYTQKILSVISVSPGYSYLINHDDSVNLLNNALNLSVDMDFSFLSIGNHTAFSFGGGAASWYDEFTLSKYIGLYSRGNYSLSLSPVFVTIMGTKSALATLGHGKNLYKKSVSKAVAVKKHKGNGKSSSGSAVTTADISSQFVPLCYEFQLPVNYTRNHFSISVIPHYDIPVHVSKPVESTLPGNPFYMVGKVTYTFSWGR